MSKKQTPSVQANVTLVEYGYQIDLLIDGKEVASSCRDFGGDYPIPEIATMVCASFINAMETLEKSILRLRTVEKIKRRKNKT